VLQPTTLPHVAIGTLKGCLNWRTLHDEEINNLYTSHENVGVIKQRRWVRHVAHMGEIGAAKKRFGRKTSLQSYNVDWVINLILKRISKMRDVKLCDGLKWLRRETMAGFCEHRGANQIAHCSDWFFVHLKWPYGCTACVTLVGKNLKEQLWPISRRSDI
jgi:hypothetical protein